MVAEELPTHARAWGVVGLRRDLTLGHQQLVRCALMFGDHVCDSQCAL